MQNQALTTELRNWAPLVTQIVRRFVRRLPPSVQEDDLLAAGTYGLVDALRKRSEPEGTAFEWYARVRIRGAIVDELRSQDWLTRRARTRLTQAEKGDANGEGGHREGPAIVALDDLPRAARAKLTDDHTPSPFDLLATQRTYAAIARAVDQLPERERLIVRLYYLQDHPFRSIAAQLGVSEPRVSQLHSRAMGLLRGLLHVDEAAAAA
jgi:RNA polymerase sigma factor for flagellar operon FliA